MYLCVSDIRVPELDFIAILSPQGGISFITCAAAIWGGAKLIAVYAQSPGPPAPAFCLFLHQGGTQHTDKQSLENRSIFKVTMRYMYFRQAYLRWSSIRAGLTQPLWNAASK